VTLATEFGLDKAIVHSPENAFAAIERVDNIGKDENIKSDCLNVFKITTLDDPKDREVPC